MLKSWRMLQGEAVKGPFVSSPSSRQIKTGLGDGWMPRARSEPTHRGGARGDGSQVRRRVNITVREASYHADPERARSQS